jgi:hypothetical protein
MIMANLNTVDHTYLTLEILEIVSSPLCVCVWELWEVWVVKHNCHWGVIMY